MKVLESNKIIFYNKLLNNYRIEKEEEYNPEKSMI